MNGTRFVHPRPALAIAMGTSLAVSGGIHAVVVGTHLREWLVAGAFFIAAAVVQAACAYAVLRWRDARGARLGAIVSVVLVAVWTMSRTVGVPVGPGHGLREAVGALDLTATAAELFAVLAFIVLRNRALPTGVVSRMSRVLAVSTVGLAFGLGAATATAMPAHRHPHDAVESSGNRDSDAAPRPAPPVRAPAGSPQPGDEARPHGSVAHEHPEKH